MLAPLRSSEPVPALMRPARLLLPPITFWMALPMIRSIGDRPEVVMVRFSPPSSQVVALEMVGVPP